MGSFCCPFTPSSLGSSATPTFALGQAELAGANFLTFFKGGHAKQANGVPGLTVSGQGAEQDDELEGEEVLMFNLTRLLHGGSVPRP